MIKLKTDNDVLRISVRHLKAELDAKSDQIKIAFRCIVNRFMFTVLIIFNDFLLILKKVKVMNFERSKVLKKLQNEPDSKKQWSQMFAI